ncbi:MAG: S1 RNA-binding domain-containing protein [Bacilli bacterium]
MNQNSYQIDEIIVGKVIDIQTYGAFVGFPNGQKGLIHISEISDDYVKRIETFLIVGEYVRVKVLAIDPSNQHLKLSIKRLIKKDELTDKAHPFWFKVPPHEIDFEPLKNMLPKWIADQKKKLED